MEAAPFDLEDLLDVEGVEAGRETVEDDAARVLDDCYVRRWRRFVLQAATYRDSGRAGGVGRESSEDGSVESTGHLVKAEHVSMCYNWASHRCTHVNLAEKAEYGYCGF